LTYLSFGDSSAGNPPRFKLTCIDWEEANQGDNGLRGKVTLVPNLSYLFSAGTIGTHRGAETNTFSTRFFSEDGFYPQQS